VYVPQRVDDCDNRVRVFERLQCWLPPGGLSSQNGPAYSEHRQDRLSSGWDIGGGTRGHRKSSSRRAGDGTKLETW
jgi:hypothetical protein